MSKVVGEVHLLVIGLYFAISNGLPQRYPSANFDESAFSPNVWMNEVCTAGSVIPELHFYKLTPDSYDSDVADYTQEVQRCMEIQSLLSSQLNYISLFEILCEEKCLTIASAEPIYRDTGHLSRFGSFYVGASEKFVAVVLAALNE